LGEEVSETFGRLIIAQLQSIAIRRSKLPPSMRKKIYLVIDEADTFLSGNSLNVILKETRKYGLHLILCTQNLIA
jgi:type IV secretory pathway TraG/TraD family ATPase VirD4